MRSPFRPFGFQRGGTCRSCSGGEELQNSAALWLRKQRAPATVYGAMNQLRLAGTAAYKALSTGAAANAALAVGAFAAGAVAMGAIALGALAIARLRVADAAFQRVRIKELTVRRLRVGELMVEDRRNS